MLLKASVRLWGAGKLKCMEPGEEETMLLQSARLYAGALRSVIADLEGLPHVDAEWVSLARTSLGLCVQFLEESVRAPARAASSAVGP